MGFTTQEILDAREHVAQAAARLRELNEELARATNGPRRGVLLRAKAEVYGALAPVAPTGALREAGQFGNLSAWMLRAYAAVFRALAVGEEACALGRLEDERKMESVLKGMWPSRLGAAPAEFVAALAEGVDPQKRMRLHEQLLKIVGGIEP